ncbi:MAG: hypothetical protein IKO57_04740 [Treponema sp.]|nr:hypothetical protein [Treponema sp.]
MKKTFLIVALMIAGLAAFAFGKKTITGHIKIYGNEPFTFVGFVTDDGEKYSLDIDPKADFTIQDIQAHQGEPLKLTGIVNDKELIGFQTLKNGRFVVSKFKVIE